MLPGRDGSGRALEWFARAHRAVLPEGWRRPKTLSAGNHTVYPSVAELVLFERSGHGRSALRNQTHAPVRTPDAERDDPQRHHDHEFPAPAGKASTGTCDLCDHLRLFVGKRPLSASGHYRRCYKLSGLDFCYRKLIFPGIAREYLLSLCCNHEPILTDFNSDLLIDTQPSMLHQVPVVV